jgi:hypothetical protein
MKQILTAVLVGEGVNNLETQIIKNIVMPGEQLTLSVES